MKDMNSTPINKQKIDSLAQDYYDVLLEKKQYVMYTLERFNQSGMNEFQHQSIYHTFHSAKSDYNKHLRILTEGEESFQYPLLPQQIVQVLALMERDHFDPKIPYSQHFIATISHYVQKNMRDKLQFTSAFRQTHAKEDVEKDLNCAKIDEQFSL